MDRIMNARPSASMVVALIALFISLSGAAWALQKNSIKSKHIVNGKVKSADLKDNGVTSTDVQDANLTGLDIADGTVTGGDITDGAIGSSDVADESLTSGDVANDSLTEADLKDVATLQGSGRISFTDATVGAPSNVQTLLTRGPFTFRGSCLNNGGGNFSAQVSFQTAVDNTSASRDTSQAADFDTAQTFFGSNAVGTAPAYEVNTYTVTAQGGSTFSGTFAAGVHNPTPNTCTFWINAIG